LLLLLLLLLLLQLLLLLLLLEEELLLLQLLLQLLMGMLELVGSSMVLWRWIAWIYSWKQSSESVSRKPSCDFVASTSTALGRKGQEGYITWREG
jgi:hypothetical protein